MQKLMIIALLTIFFAPVSAEDLEGDYLYRVSTIRAAPGSLAPLLDWILALKASDHFDDAGEPAPFIMRHSQGDQWDLMVISPMQSWAAYYGAQPIEKRRAAVAAYAKLLSESDRLVAFAEDHFAFGPDLEILRMQFEANNMFHIEMFAAAPGLADDLLQQRRMENSYLQATEQKPNLIFRRAAGSDIDVFTIGFHDSLEAFAAPSPVSDEAKETAAIAAGFKDRADLSFYLRSLMSSHHDTLAVKVK